MNVLSQIKRNMKKAVVPVGVAGAVVTATATSSFAALDLTAISNSIATAITDITSAAVLLAGAFAAVWGVKQVIYMFKK